ncbi:MAG: B12-binding domain-containing radical SAM protein [Nitrospirae bacterium]|nr:B12-binding domain-containing radical SAM protein [Nitrospirota bacterium]
MRLTFISPYEDIVAFGIRILSAYLKKFGHATKIIFLCRERGKHANINYQSGEILDSLVDICKDSDLVGISLMTNHFNPAVSITQGLKSRLNIPIIWGGVHPTIMPEDCLNYADIVCIGEGEVPVLELIQKMEEGKDYFDTKSLWFRNKKNVIRNQIGGRINNLDALPFPDYDLEDHYILKNGKIKKADKDLIKEHFTQTRKIQCANRPKYVDVIYNLVKPKSLEKQHAIRDLAKYITSTTRGCPHNCTYCGNNALRKMHGATPYLRRRSVEHIINELLEAQKKMEYISMISFVDDNFFTAGIDELRNFSKLYKEKINLPFACTVSPHTIGREKMCLLVDAGLRLVKMGIESGSDKTLKLYNRGFMSTEKIKEASWIINEYKSKVIGIYDIITDNPYETKDDIIKTFRLLLELPRPYRLQIYSFTPIPGTKLYEMAKKDNLIKDENKEIIDKVMETDKEINYVNFLLALFNYNIPKPILRILSNKNTLNILGSKAFKGIYIMAYKAYHFLKLKKL